MNVSEARAGDPNFSQPTSSYAGQLISIVPNRSNKGSKNGSKARSKASSAAHLKLKLDEVENRMAAEFSREADKRSRRRLAREMTKMEAERKRQAEELEREQESQREQMEAERRRQAEELEREQRRQRERLEANRRQQQMEIDMERERIEEEAAEREANTKYREAVTKAKRETLEKHMEEQSERSASVSIGVTEIAPFQKAAAYVNEAVKLEAEFKEPSRDPDCIVRPKITIPSKIPISPSWPRANPGDKIDKVVESSEYCNNDRKNDYDNFPSVEYQLPACKAVSTYTTPALELRPVWATNPVQIPYISPGFEPNKGASKQAGHLQKKTKDFRGSNPLWDSPADPSHYRHDNFIAPAGLPVGGKSVMNSIAIRHH